jgi:hypothetical protein
MPGEWGHIVTSDFAEKISLPARYGHGAKGLAPSKGINKFFSLYFGGRQSFGAGAQQAFLSASFLNYPVHPC